MTFEETKGGQLVINHDGDEYRVLVDHANRLIINVDKRLIVKPRSSNAIEIKVED